MANELFASFCLSTKEPYTIMLCPSSLASVLSLALSSVHTFPWHRVRYRNFIFGRHVHMCPPHMHIKYLVILTCWLIWYSTKRAYVIMICPSCIVVVQRWRWRHLVSASAASVHSPPSHRIQDRNFIFSMNMHMCPQYMHIKYLVILTCSF